MKCITIWADAGSSSEQSCVGHRIEICDGNKRIIVIRLLKCWYQQEILSFDLSPERYVSKNTLVKNGCWNGQMHKSRNGAPKVEYFGYKSNSWFLDEHWAFWKHTHYLILVIHIEDSFQEETSTFTVLGEHFRHEDVTRRPSLKALIMSGHSKNIDMGRK